MSKKEDLLRDYIEGVKLPEVSGFEALELLDIRSSLADLEVELNEAERKRLEEADSVFLQNAERFYDNISRIADLLDMRRRAKTPPSHWWWYLEKLVKVERITASGKT